MEDWTQDLATALDESSNNISKHKLGQSNLKKQTIYVSSRRRTKSTGNICENNFESSGTEDENTGPTTYAHSSMQQTETDDGSARDRMRSPLPSSSTMAAPVFRPFASTNQIRIPGLCGAQRVGAKLSGESHCFAESDSVNEATCTMRPSTKRKRRFKRMAIDPEPLPLVPTLGLEPASSNFQQTSDRGFPFSTFASSSVFSKPKSRRSKNKSVKIPKLHTFAIGKRKRSMRERSIECELEKICLNSSPESDMENNATSGRSCDFHSDSKGHMADSEMDIRQQGSSSSLSCSESDPGFYTNDEAREADDEQSDWYHETGPTWGIAGYRRWWERNSKVRHDSMAADDDEDSEEESLRAHTASWRNGSEAANEGHKFRMQKLRDRIHGREIRAGCRRLGEQRGPSFSILTSANEKLSRFLQDPGQSELRLHPMQKSEREQLSQLATLYSLEMKSEGARGLKCPVLTKTSNTMQAVRIDLERSPASWNDYKRQKKTPPASLSGAPEEDIQPEDSQTSHYGGDAGDTLQAADFS